MAEGKRNIIHQLLEEYDIRIVEGHSGCPEGSAETIREMMEAEISWERVSERKPTTEQTTK